jgi:microsomal dipeptidase-like Zn-dependent dipeptidase
MVAKSVDIMGIDHVGIGTDRSHNFTKPDYDWMRMGRWTRGIDYGAASAARPGKAPPPAWFTEVHHLGLLPGGLRDVGFSPTEVEKITSGNWLRLYRDVFPGRQVAAAKAEFVQTDPVLATSPRLSAAS